MKKFLIISFICLLCTACSKHTLYLTPEAVGYIYDKKTHQPLKHQTGYIGFSGLTKDKDSKIILQEDGGFSIPAVTETYYFIRPNMRRESMNPPPEIYISLKKYDSKIIDYSKTYIKQVPYEKTGYYHYNKINLGIIYLDPVKE